MNNELNKKSVYILNKHIPENGETLAGGDNLINIYRNLQNPEILIPVIGLQGVGKSTLINGILKENIMPNEADETTCIPVEVRYGDIPSVQIYFLDGKSRDITHHEICQYVDNNYNKGNKKQVSHLIVYRNIEFLKSGIVLVDLPGVGSMTLSNQEVTKRYIKNIYSAIFVIRVNPPITRTEALFIKLAWNGLSNAWFIQNRWNNENDREVAEGLDANQVILKDIAEKTHTPYNSEIITINAYKALVGISQNKPESYKESNISVIADKMTIMYSNWRTQAETSYYKKVVETVVMVKGIINDKMNKCRMSKEELTEKLRTEEESFNKNSVEIKKQILEVIKLLDAHKIESITFIKKLTREAEENIRANINRVIDGGITDGEDLSQAFIDYQVQEFEIINNEYINFVVIKQQELSDKAEELNDIIQHEQENNFNTEAFNKNQELKWEKGMEAGIKIAGGLGGVAVGIKVGGALGTVVAGPVGMIIGIAAGAVAGGLISIFTGLIGGESKKIVTSQRASATRKQISPIIEELCENIQKQLMNSFNSICDRISADLGQYCEDRIQNNEIVKDENMKLLRLDNNAEELLQKLSEEYTYMTELEVQYIV